MAIPCIYMVGDYRSALCHHLVLSHRCVAKNTSYKGSHLRFRHLINRTKKSERNPKGQKQEWKSAVNEMWVPPMEPRWAPREVKGGETDTAENIATRYRYITLYSVSGTRPSGLTTTLPEYSVEEYSSVRVALRRVKLTSVSTTFWRNSVRDNGCERERRLEKKEVMPSRTL